MQKILHLLLLVILALPSCKDSENLLDCSDFNLEELSGSSEKNKIIDAIVEDYFPEIGFIHVVQESGNEVILNSIYLTLEVLNDPIDTQLVMNYVSVNENFDLIGTKIKKPARLITSEEIMCLQSFERYYDKYPESAGYLTFNNIAFNDAEDVALVEFGHFQASLGATGQLVFLKKEGNSWVITTKFLTWIS